MIDLRWSERPLARVLPSLPSTSKAATRDGAADAADNNANRWSRKIGDRIGALA